MSLFYVASLAGLVGFYAVAGVPALDAEPELKYIELMSGGAGRALFTLFAQFVFPVYITYVFLIRKKRSFDLLALFGFLAIIAMTRRYPIIDAVMVLAVGLNYTGYKWRLKPIALGSAAMVLFLFAVNYVRNMWLYQGLSLQETLLFSSLDILRRLFVSQGTAVTLAIQSIPLEYGFFGGFTYIDHLWSVISRSQPVVSLGKLLFEMRFMGIHTMAEGYLPPTFVGEAFANFGLSGIAFMFAFGIAIQSAYVLFLFARKNDYVFTIFVVFTAYMARSAILGLTGSLINLIYFVAVYSSIIAAASVMISAARERKRRYTL